MARLNPNVEYELIESIKSDDVTRFHEALLRSGININQPLMWLERRSGRSGFHCLQRTPLMIAATLGCLNMVDYIMGFPGIRVKETSISDGLAAIDCAFLSGTPKRTDIILRLIPIAWDLAPTSASEHQPVYALLYQQFERSALHNAQNKHSGQFGEGAPANDQNNPDGTVGPSHQRGGQNMETIQRRET